MRSLDSLINGGVDMFGLYRSGIELSEFRSQGMAYWRDGDVGFATSNLHCSSGTRWRMHPPQTNTRSPWMRERERERESEKWKHAFQWKQCQQEECDSWVSHSFLIVQYEFSLAPVCNNNSVWGKHSLSRHHRYTFTTLQSWVVSLERALFSTNERKNRQRSCFIRRRRRKQSKLNAPSNSHIFFYLMFVWIQSNNCQCALIRSQPVFISSLLRLTWANHIFVSSQIPYKYTHTHTHTHTYKSAIWNAEHFPQSIRLPGDFHILFHFVLVCQIYNVSMCM